MRVVAGMAVEASSEEAHSRTRESQERPPSMQPGVQRV